MKFVRLAVFAAAASLAFASAQAVPHAHVGGGHMGGAHTGGSHFNGHAGHFPQHGAFRHDGHFVHGFHGRHLGGWFVVGGVWYPWYAAAAPVYTQVWSYYCPSADAYYPSVAACPEGWVLVAPPAPAS
jgi:hypothetical protein